MNHLKKEIQALRREVQDCKIEKNKLRVHAVGPIEVKRGFQLKNPRFDIEKYWDSD